MHDGTPMKSPAARRYLWQRFSSWLVASGSLLSLVVLIALSSPAQSPNKPLLMPEANRLPDANEQMMMREQKEKKTNYETANVERQRQIAEDSAKLLELAKELKSEVDKTSKDTLSINVIRKAETIEKLAHGLKEKMKLTVGAG